MDNSLSITLNGVPVLILEDTDAETIANALRTIAESVERFGVKATLRVTNRKLQETVCVEAKPTHGMLSTVIS